MQKFESLINADSTHGLGYLLTQNSRIQEADDDDYVVEMASAKVATVWSSKTLSLALGFRLNTSVMLQTATQKTSKNFSQGHSEIMDAKKKFRPSEKPFKSANLPRKMKVKVLGSTPAHSPLLLIFCLLISRDSRFTSLFLSLPPRRSSRQLYNLELK